MATWIMVADAARARLFKSNGAVGELQELAGYTHPEGRMSASELGHGRPDRAHESASSARHGVEPRTDPVDKSAHQFAHELADVLETGRLQNAYQHLTLVAPPRFLGQLTDALPNQVAKHLQRRISKDWTRASVSDIRAGLLADRE